jgi:hypothetical protein
VTGLTASPREGEVLSLGGDDAADFVRSTNSIRSIETRLKVLERANSAMEMDKQSNQRQIRDLEARLEKVTAILSSGAVAVLDKNAAATAPAPATNPNLNNKKPLWMKAKSTPSGRVDSKEGNAKTLGMVGMCPQAKTHIASSI